MQEFINYLVDIYMKIGIQATLIFYFCWKDYKFETNREETTRSIAVSLALINGALGLKDVKNG